MLSYILKVILIPTLQHFLPLRAAELMIYPFSSMPEGHVPG